MSPSELNKSSIRINAVGREQPGRHACQTMRRAACPLSTLLLVLAGAITLSAATVTVEVSPPGPNSHTFVPDTVSIQPGDTVHWIWKESFHSVTAGNPDTGQTTGAFDTDVKNSGFEFSHTFQDAGSFTYFCTPHRSMGMSGRVNVGATQTAAQPLNVSTRLRVQTGEGAMIGGFIITGNVAKKVIVRAIGPSLVSRGIADVLSDPTVQLNGPGGVIATNDDWKAQQQAEVESSGVAPTDERESAIVASLSPGNYTAIMQGKDGATGVGLVEVYDLDQPADAKLANISTRGRVETGTNVMIGGFILGNGSAAANVIVRAMGPSLSASGINDVLANPTLELRDGNGGLVRANDNWKESQQSEIEATGVPPKNDLESAVVATVTPGNYTAIVAGSGGTTGVGLVELYRLQ